MKIPAWTSELTLDPKEALVKDSNLSPERQAMVRKLDKTNPEFAKVCREQWSGDDYSRDSGKLRHIVYRDEEMRRVIVPEGDSAVFISRHSSPGAVSRNGALGLNQETIADAKRNLPEARAQRAALEQQVFNQMIRSGMRPTE